MELGSRECRASEFNFWSLQCSRQCYTYYLTLHSEYLAFSFFSLRCRIRLARHLPEVVSYQPRQYFQGERKCAPLFENVSESLLSGSCEWRAVPDIWKTAAEKYGDRIALVDPHRQPPAQITYKQVSNSILFSLPRAQCWFYQLDFHS